MKNLSPKIELINQIVSHGINVGVAQVKVENQFSDGRLIEVGNKRLTYFGNCSYLGLELDERIKESSIDAIKRYGTQFACSRTYAHLTLYDELESLLFQIFNKPTLVSPTTTLGHIANITTLVNPEDAIILDHQVHASVHNAVQIVKASGTYVEVMRHNRMDILESRIQKLKEKHSRIWYMSDGIYSMYGDSAPIKDMYDLMNKYEQLWCYIDDAHGMSWTGKNGSGAALSQMPSFHERLLLTVSLVKGFGVHGGALIFPNTEMRDVVRNCGSTLMFSSPMPPSNLAGCIQSAKIHLTDEIYDLQDKLKKKISYFVMTAKGLGIPLINEELTPIFFISLGIPEVGYDISSKMIEDGFLLNMAVFPAVSYKNTGMRVNVTNHHSIEDIYEMLSALRNNINEINLKNMHKNNLLHQQEAFPMSN